jgi:hypothetical protein
MLWGAKQIGDFQNLVKQGYATKVFGMNEPNQVGQSNMSPGDGAELWMRYIQPLKNEGYTLISPGCTNAATAKPWMQDFLSACTDCTVDAFAVHVYTNSFQEMIDYLKDFYNTFQKPIWVTEFACNDFSNGSCPDVYEFMGKVQSFMDQTDWIHGYSAFGVEHNMVGVHSADQLLDGDDQPTALGSFYINN